MAIRTQCPIIISRGTSGPNATSKIRTHSTTIHTTNNEPSMARPRCRSAVRPEPGAAGTCVSVAGRGYRLAGTDWARSRCALALTIQTTVAKTNTTPDVKEAKKDTPSATSSHGGGSPVERKVRTKKHAKVVTQAAKVMPALREARLYRSVCNGVMFLQGECPYLRILASSYRIRSIHGA